MLKHTFKQIGIWIFIVTFLIAFASSFVSTKSWDSTSLQGIILEIMGFVSLFLIAFSKEREDDEYLSHLRVKSITITLILSFTYAVVDSFFFEVNHLMIMEVFQIQILVYIILFHILKIFND